MMVIKRLDQPHQMARRSQNDQDMEDLVTAAPDIETAGSPFLRHPCCVETGTSNVQHTLQNNPVKSNALAKVLDTVEFDAVQNGKDSRKAHQDEHERSERPECRGAELGVDAGDGCACGESGNLNVLAFAS